MHLCYLCNEYPPRRGGIGTFTATLGQAMASRGHQVTVIGLYHQEATSDTHEHGVRVIRIRHGRIRGINLAVNRRRLNDVLRQVHAAQPIDLVEGPENSFALFPKRSIAPRVIRMHGGHRFFTVTTGYRPRPWRSLLERRSFAVAEHLCAVSQFVADTTRQLLALGDRPIDVIANPVDVERFRERPDIAVEDGLLLFVGAVREKKGAMQLVQAMPEILRQVPHARLVLAGPDIYEPKFGGSFTSYLRTLVSPAVSSRVVFQGPVPHDRLAELIARAHVCVYPSHSEAMPIAWIEAMASGKPVVASVLGPGPELIDDGRHGVLCDPRDPSSIATAVIRVLRDRDLARKLGREARRRALERYSLGVLVQQNEDFYQRCVSGPGHG